MNRNKFEVVSIERIQLPHQYKSYYFNREYFIEKKETIEQKKKEKKDDQKEKEDQEKYELYYPFEVKEEGQEDSYDFDNLPKEESKADDAGVEDGEEKILEEEKHNDHEEDRKEEAGNYIDLCKKGEKFLFYVPRTTLKRKVKGNMLQEYQTIEECVEEKGILPIHTKNAELNPSTWKITHGHQVRSNKKKDVQLRNNKKGKVDRVGDSSDSESGKSDEDFDDSDNEREFDKMTLFGIFF